MGTHALKPDAKSKLWNRLRTHRGTIGGKFPGGGNHRCSVFRKHVGSAIIERDNWSGNGSENWGVGSSSSGDARKREHNLEQEVSQYIRRMPFLWLKVDDQPESHKLRSFIEQNAIAMLSNYNYQDSPIHPPSENWLGCYTRNEKILHSGLWNVRHVDEPYTPGVLDSLEQLIAK